MIENKYLIEWVKENYPMMEINSDSELSELDYTDFDKFAKWLVKKLTIPDVSDKRELFDFKNWWNKLPDGSDDRLFISKGTIKRFLKSNSR